MQPLHETAAQSANTSNTGAPTDSAPQTSLPIHASAAIFPPMREAEFEALVADIREKGQLEAVWLWQGQVIDGRHRVLACQKLGLTPKTREWDGQGSLLEFIVSANLRRRHLKENQRAMVAARMLPQFEVEAEARRKAGGVVVSNHAANLRQGRAAHHVALLLSVSERSVNFAKKLREHGIPSLNTRVDEGKLAVSTAAKIAEFPPDEQQRLLTLNRRELAAKFRPAKPESSVPKAEPVAPALRPGQTEAERARDDMFVRSVSLLNYKHVGLKRCGDGLRLKLSMKDWRAELSELLNSDVFPHLLERGFVVIRSDDVEK